MEQVKYAKFPSKEFMFIYVLVQILSCLEQGGPRHEDGHLKKPSPNTPYKNLPRSTYHNSNNQTP